MNSSVVIIIVILVISVVVIGINKEKRDINNNMEQIRKSYSFLTGSINKYNDIRTEYIDKTSVLILDDFKDKHADFINILDQYNEVMKNIDSYISNINYRCMYLYNDNEINNICNSYKGIYEKVVNLYVNDLNNYNNLITKYNEYNEEKLPLYEMVHKDYIDYDNDSVFLGRNDSNEK